MALETGSSALLLHQPDWRQHGRAVALLYRSMLYERFEGLHRIRDLEGLHREIAQFASSYGFSTATAVGVLDQLTGRPTFVQVAAATPAQREIQLREDSGTDPVSQYLKRSHVPMVYNQDTYTKVGLGARHEEQAAVGMAEGIALAIHTSGGRHFLFGVDGEGILPKGRELFRLVADVTLYAQHLLGAAEALLLPEALALNTENLLTPREIEVLSWNSEGLTSAQIGDRLNISERTVVAHTNSAIHKLQAGNKAGAVSKALRLGLIA